MDNKWRNEHIKLDEILKSLFTSSNKVMLDFINNAFNEEYTYDTELVFENNEFPTCGFDMIRADMIIKVLGKKQVVYHVEFQTKKDADMAIRMFEYGFHKAKKEAEHQKNTEELYFPKQLVIYIEENNSIEDELNLLVVFPDGTEADYNVPVIKNWEYDARKLIENKLYVLLPLQILKYRKKLEIIKSGNSADKKEQLRELLNEAKKTAFVVAKEAGRLVDTNKLYDSDFDKLLSSVENLMEYLNRKYLNDENVRNEVRKMVKTLYDPLVEKRALERKAVEIAKNLLDMGMETENIAKATGLDLKKIIEIKKCIDSK
ncbi:hypothetical protein [Clostridium oryzae]|uniref:PD-(D/E)XK nuclease family transposase n=1 Tax=Clostridium oryzae TaxID=1450648 RepID=A0A1V4IIV6_9CLOT|nr:hypothetical protein [Clostridium oryzae]OPJ59774.1 hypothetical protein CLORY_31190 [Clostridium oryzae]